MKRLLLLLVCCLQFPLFSLEIYRPENYGELNGIPCLISVTDESGADAASKIRHMSYNWYYELPRPAFSRQPKKLHGYFTGCFSGGAVVHLLLEPGVYNISVYTPVDRQQDYAKSHAGLEAGKAWTSNTFVYDTRAPFPAGKPRVIWVEPVADENGFFNGRWQIGVPAPKFYRYTKPSMPDMHTVSDMQAEPVMPDGRTTSGMPDGRTQEEL
ncbi:MAG: hypothetical protein K6G80_05525 [Treponema sp.]|nr:hypothetical protein [Treponema sp.]